MSFVKNRQEEREKRMPQNFPCIKEKDQSMKCLDANNYDYTKCEAAFENYKFCLKFWEVIRKERKRLRIEPEMPSAEERSEIFRIYSETGRAPDFSKKAA